MATHKAEPGNKLTRTWARFTAVNLWSPGVLFASAIVFGIATYLMDVLRTGNSSLLWALTYFASLAFAVILVFIANLGLRSKSSSKNPGRFNLLVAMLVGGFKNLSVAVMANLLGLETQVGFGFRFIGGLLMGAIILSIYAGFAGSRLAHKQALSKLGAIRNDLLGSRENLGLLLADELESLQQKSRESVLPKIAQISQLLHTSTDAEKLAKEISETVSNNLRPLMQEISSSSPSLLRSAFEQDLQRVRVKTPKQFVARDVVRPLTYLAYTLPAISSLGFYFEGFAGAIVGAVATLSFVLFMWVFKVLLLPKRATPRLVSYLMLTGAAILSPVVGLYVIGGLLPLTASVSVLLPFVCWVICIGIVLTVSPTALLDLESAKLERIIEVENASLAKEIALFEQKVWVFKRRWLFVLHGTVQSALTAALTRLQTFAESDPYQVSLVQADLERAEIALQTVPSNEIDFDKAAVDLKEAWAGVCAITVKVDMRASRALVTNQGSAYCVNEILKEAIGNAVRHGTATAALVSITREEDDYLDIEVQNDGVAPPKRRKGGIGSRMLDDITTSWDLDRSGRLTTLKARLPL
jgi:hypothetical protein